jgi:choice-of-anchor C domain-containing protein
MNDKHLLRRGAALGLCVFALAGCGGPDSAVINEPAVGNVAQGVNVISNGSFENNVIGNVNYVVLNAGSTALPGWTITSGIKVLKNSYKAAQNGVQSIDLNGLGAGALYQDVPTVVGGGYTVSFYVSNSPACATVSRSATIDYGPSSASFSNASASWSLRSYVFNATSTTSRITLTSTSGGVGCGLAIDNLQVNGP